MKESSKKLNQKMGEFTDFVLKDLDMNNPETWVNMDEYNLIALKNLMELTHAISDYTNKVNEMIDMLDKRTEELLSKK